MVDSIREHDYIYFFPCRRPVGWDGPPASYWRGSPAFPVLAGEEREAAGARWQLPNTWGHGAGTWGGFRRPAWWITLDNMIYRLLG